MGKIYKKIKIKKKKIELKKRKLLNMMVHNFLCTNSTLQAGVEDPALGQMSNFS